jgi:methylated-DNA-[protein]-cysteine S-methyltransferase
VGSRTPGELTFTTAFGPCGLAWSVVGLTRVRVLDSRDVDDAPTDLPDFVTFARGCLERYFAGERIDFAKVRLDASAVSAFNARIYDALRRVPFGTTTTYGALAKTAGADVGASRAVGMAMGRNPWPIIVPCHRVLASGGKICGFSAPGGAETKQRLLALEGMVMDGGQAMLPGLFG